MDKFKNVLSNNLKSIRLENGYTQQYIADLLGISRQAVGYHEKGAFLIDIEQAYKLSKLYGCSVDDLLTGVDCD